MGHAMAQYFLAPLPGEGKKGQISLNFNYKFNYVQRFLNKTLCVFSQLKDIKHIRQDLGVLVGQKFSFLNMVIWHIKLKGMISRPGYTEKFYPRIKLGTLGWGQMVKYH